MLYHFKIHKEKDGGFWAQCVELPGCLAQADTMEELYENMEEALNLYIEEPSNSSDLATLPDESLRKTKNVVEIAVNPLIAFAFLMRYFRIKEGLTQKEAAKKMGLDSLYSYQRLEAKKCNPSLKMILKVKKIFPEFPIDLAVRI